MNEKKKTPKLGQHWLQDPQILTKIASYLEVSPNDFILEIGPGLGTLTSKLLKFNPKTLLAVEFDSDLAHNLPNSFPGKQNLIVQNSDIRKFNFEELPAQYKLATNLPYYISGIFFRILTTIQNKPSLTVALIQKEVAQKISASPESGSSNKLAMLVNYFYQTELGIEVSAEHFSPPPKVDSQVLILSLRSKPLFPDIGFKTYSRLVKFAFSSPRKTLANNLSAGFRVPRSEILKIIESLGLDLEIRAEQLSLRQWQELFAKLK